MTEDIHEDHGQNSGNVGTVDICRLGPGRMRISLPNPSFEKKTIDGVQGWTSRAWHGKENARWSVGSSGRTGEHCISIASGEGADAAWTTTVTVKPNAWYVLSGWIKTKEVRGATGALLNIQNMQAVRTAPVSGTRDWTQVSTVFQATATELEINCLFGGWGTSTGQAWYDDVTLEPAEAPPPETEATVTIDTDAPAKTYSPMIFGGFLEHFDNQIYGGVFEPGSPLADEKGFRLDVIEALKELKVPVIRWPGGCFVDAYHWQKGVGKNRESYGDPRWGVIEPNTFGTDEFVELCRRIGAEPYICFNGLADPRRTSTGWPTATRQRADLPKCARRTATPNRSMSSSGASATNATTRRIFIGSGIPPRP